MAKLPVITSHSYKLNQLVLVSKYWKVGNSFHLGSNWRYPILPYYMPKELCMDMTKLCLHQIHIQFGLSQMAQKLTKLLHMMIPIITIHNNVINVGMATVQTANYTINHELEGGRSVLHSKWHDCVLIQIIRNNKRRYLSCSLGKWHLPIALQ